MAEDEIDDDEFGPSGFNFDDDPEVPSDEKPEDEPRPEIDIDDVIKNDTKKEQPENNIYSKEGTDVPIMLVSELEEDTYTHNKNSMLLRNFLFKKDPDIVLDWPEYTIKDLSGWTTEDKIQYNELYSTVINERPSGLNLYNYRTDSQKRPSKMKYAGLRSNHTNFRATVVPYPFFAALMAIRNVKYDVDGDRGNLKSMIDGLLNTNVKTKDDGTATIREWWRFDGNESAYRSFYMKILQKIWINNTPLFDKDGKVIEDDDGHATNRIHASIVDDVRNGFLIAEDILENNGLQDFLDVVVKGEEEPEGIVLADDGKHIISYINPTNKFADAKKIFIDTYKAEANRTFYGLTMDTEALNNKTNVVYSGGGFRDKYKMDQYEHRVSRKNHFVVAFEKSMVFWPKDLIDDFLDEMKLNDRHFSVWPSDLLLEFYRIALSLLMSSNPTVANLMNKLFLQNVNHLTKSQVDTRSANISRGENVWNIKSATGEEMLAFSSSKPNIDEYDDEGERIYWITPFFSTEATKFGYTKFKDTDIADLKKLAFSKIPLYIPNRNAKTGDVPFSDIDRWIETSSETPTMDTMRDGTIIIRKKDT